MEVSFDIDPIVVYQSKHANIQRFNHEEAERERLHRDDALPTKLLHVSVVLAVIAFAFLIFFKLCWDKEKFLRRRRPRGTGSRRTSLSSGSHPTVVVGHRAGGQNPQHETAQIIKANHCTTEKQPRQRDDYLINNGNGDDEYESWHTVNGSHNV